MAGAPFFFGDGKGDEVELGGSLVPGVGMGLKEGVGDSAGLGVGEREALRFFFGEGLGEESGVGVGEDLCFFFDEAGTLGSGVSEDLGVGDALRFFGGAGDGDFAGFGEAGFSASSFFFGAVELLRCFRGAGVGVGAKILLILLPNDSSALARSAAPRNIAISKNVPAIFLARRMERESSTRARDE